MSYIPSEEEINQYEDNQPSFGKKALDYEKGLGTQLLKSGSKGGYNIAHFLANLPSNAFEAISGKPLYKDIVPKPDVEEFFSKSESGQTGKHVGETVSDLASLMIPGSAANKALRALSKFHPLTKGQVGRRFEGPIKAAENAGVRRELDNNRLYDLNDLLSHPALEAKGAAGRGLTPMGRQAVIQGAAEGNIPSLHSAQSLLGDLERVIPGLGESALASSRVRPLKEHILEQIIQGMKEKGIPEEAENYQQARAGAKRYYQTKKNIKKITKPLSIAAIIKGLMGASKNLP